MSREELVSKIDKLNKQRGLFLAFGIILLVLGVITTIVGGVILGIKQYELLGSNPTFDEIAHLYVSPYFVLPVMLATIFIMGGVALLVLRGVLLGIKLRNAKRELESINQ